MSVAAGVRRVVVPCCRYCLGHQGDSMMPPHDPSPYCESGGRPHCTCDTCY